LCYKILHISGIFSAHHQEFSTVHSELTSFMQVVHNRFQTESSRLCLEAVNKKKTYMKLTSYECTVENSWWWTEKKPQTC